MSLQGTRAAFDPLSAAGGTSVKVSPPSRIPASTAAPTEDTVQAAAAAAAATAAVGEGGEPPSEYDSFMTAHSVMSYTFQTASQGMSTSSMATVPLATPLQPSHHPEQSSAMNPHYLDRRPTATVSSGRDAAGSSTDRYNPFMRISLATSPAAAAVIPEPPDSLLPKAQDDSDTAKEPSYGKCTAGPMDPLSFADVDGSTKAPRTTVAFAMPHDLYDTPDMFMRSATTPPAAPVAAAPAPLPPLYDFTRGFSRSLPVRENPSSSVSSSSVAYRTNWYGNAQSAFVVGTSSGGDSRDVIGPLNRVMTSAVGGSSSSPTSGGAAAAATEPVTTPGLTSYADAALLTNTVTVHSPRKMSAPSRIPGVSEPYITYSITSRNALNRETTVQRRFRDVVALGDLLQSLYPGCFVPPRPSRNAVEGRRMQASFIEERRAGIAMFLRRLIVHPVLGPSEATHFWLHSHTTDLRSCPEWIRLMPAAPPGLAKSTARLLFQVVGVQRSVPSPLEVLRPASERGDMYWLVHERTVQMRGVLQKFQPSPAEVKLREEAAALQERSAVLVSLSRCADHQISCSSKYGKVLGDLGTTLLAQAAVAELVAVEGLAPLPPASALMVAAEALGSVSKLYGVATNVSAKHLTTIHDWLAAVSGATVGLAARERCLLTSVTLQYDEAEAKGRLAEAEARAGGNGVVASSHSAATRKVEALRQQVLQLGVSLMAARDEYERVGSRNLAEVNSFKVHMSRELADSMREYGLVQLAAAQKAHDIWMEAAGKLTTLAAEAAVAAIMAAGDGGSRRDEHDSGPEAREVCQQHQLHWAVHVMLKAV